MIGVIKDIFSSRYLLKIVIATIMLCSCQSNNTQQPTANHGTIDFSNWDFNQDGIANLNGEWNFYWGEAVNHSSQIAQLKYTGLCEIQGFWTEGPRQDTYFEQNGLATYHLKLILPDTVQQYTLKLNAVFTAYSLWADGKLLAQAGTPTLDPKTTIPGFETKLISLPKKKELNLFLQVASWEHKRGGGILDFILIGTEKQIKKKLRNNTTSQLIFNAMTFGLGVYLLALFLFYSDNWSYLYVGLFTLLGTFRAVCVDEMVINYIFDDFPYFWNHRLRYIGFYGSIGCIVLAVDDLFKGYVHKYIKYLAFTLLLFSLSTLIVPFRWSSYLAPIFQLIAVVAPAYCIYSVVKTVRAKENVVEAILFCIGGLVIFSDMIHELIQVQILGFSNNVQYHNFGYAFFIFSQVLILAYRNKKTYTKANLLSEELLDLNRSLDDKIEERTQEISAQKDRIGQQAKELASANERLQELDKIKNRFFANISHELRTPLTLILGSLDKFKRKNSADFPPELSSAKKHASLLHQLINQLLDITKLEAGKMELNLTAQPLVGLLKSYLQSFEALAYEKSITLEFHSNQEECHAMIDKQAFEKIVYNLLSNAYKFTPDHGSITLGVNVHNAELMLLVSDTGIGIPEQELPLIFNRFYQVDTSMQRNYEGTGIGLSLVKELVELHEGDIQVSSRIGEGTTFKLKIPIQTVGESDHNEIRAEIGESLPKELYEIVATTTQTGKLLQDSDKSIVLIVEDHLDLQDLIAEELMHDYSILKANNGQEGLAMALEEIPDLIISDVMMPYKNGYELCEALKTDERTSHIPIILLTARTARENKLQGLEVGADDYMAKPFDSAELTIRVKNLISNRALLREKFSQQSISVQFTKELAQNATEQSFLDKLLSLLEDNFADEQYDVAQMAEALNMSKRQLHRKLLLINLPAKCCKLTV